MSENKKKVSSMPRRITMTRGFYEALCDHPAMKQLSKGTAVDPDGLVVEIVDDDGSVEVV